MLARMRAIGSVGLALMTGACINPVGVSNYNSIEGSGFLVTEARGVSGFDGITVSGAGLVIVEQTGFESLHITTDDNILRYIVTEVRGGMSVVVVNVRDRLTASASGVALIEYVGRPQVIANVSGGATIRRH